MPIIAYIANIFVEFGGALGEALGEILGKMLFVVFLFFTISFCSKMVKSFCVNFLPKWLCKFLEKIISAVINNFMLICWFFFIGAIVLYAVSIFYPLSKVGGFVLLIYPIVFVSLYLCGYFLNKKETKNKKLNVY